MMWTALAIRLFVVINESVSVTFKGVKLGHGGQICSDGIV
jgi:hypothetical protein